MMRELGRVAFGAVYLAQDERLNHRAVAVKVLHPQLTVDAETLHLFDREAGASPSSSLLVKSAKCTEKLTADYFFV